MELADTFIETRGGPDQFELIPCEDGIGRRLGDAGQAELWLSFHEEHARLVISDQANLRRKRKTDTE